MAFALRAASRLIVIGYSAPRYDVAAHVLLAENVPQTGEVEVLDCYESVADTYRRIFPGRAVRFHGKLLNALPALKAIVNDACRDRSGWLDEHRVCSGHGRS